MQSDRGRKNEDEESFHEEDGDEEEIEQEDGEDVDELVNDEVAAKVNYF